MKVKVLESKDGKLEVVLDGTWAELDFEKREVTVPDWLTCPRCGCEGEDEATLSFKQILNLAQAITLGREALEALGA